MKKKDFNSFDRTVEMFEDMGADHIFLSHFDPPHVIGEAYNSKTGQRWAIAMVNSIDEALECKYPLVCNSKDKKLVAYLEKHRKTSREL